MKLLPDPQIYVIQYANVYFAMQNVPLYEAFIYILQYVCTRQVSICKIYAVRQPFNPISDTSEFLIFIFHATISLLLGWGVDIFFDRSEQVK